MKNSTEYKDFIDKGKKSKKNNNTILPQKVRGLKTTK